MEDFRLIDSTFGGFISGKILDSAIIGVLCFVVVSIMKMPYPMLISVIVGVTNIIPFFGPFIGSRTLCIAYFNGQSDAMPVFYHLHLDFAAV